jgi:peroxiredoxin
MMLRSGNHAPSFRFSELAGDELTLEKLKAGGSFALAFFKVSCPTCQFALPFLSRLRDGDTRLIAVSQDKPEHTKLFAEKFGAPLHYVLDRMEDGYPASNAFGIHHVPTIFVVNQQGRIEEVIEGFDKMAFEELGVEFLPGENVPAYKPG